MKKKSVILLLLLIVFLGLTLTACKTKTKSTVTTTKKTQSSSLTQSTKGTSSKDTTKSSSETVTQTITPTETQPQPVKLSTPAIRIERSIITIIGSEGATKFKVYINNQLVEENLDARAYTLANITTPGTYEVYVIAVGNGTDKLDSDKSNTITYVVEEPPIETIQLSTPVIRLNGDTVSWPVNLHAVKYEVYIDDQLVDSNVTTGSYSLSSITEEGTYNIQVKAIGDGSVYTDSNLSNVVVYRKTSTVNPVQLDTPVLTRNGETLSWNEIEDAEGYQVYVNGEIAGTPTTNTQYQIPDTLPIGTYVFKVKALGNDVNTLDSELSNGETYILSDEYTYDELKVDGTLTKTTYVKGLDTELDLSGLTFIAVYSDGVEFILDVDQDLEISSVDLTTPGEKTITISYTENGVTHSTEIQITVVEKSVQSIEISLAQTAKTEYKEGDSELNLAGITINVIYDNGTQDSNKKVKEEMIDYTSFSLSTHGTYNVRVTYGGKTATFEITVTENVYLVELKVTGELAQKEFKYNHVLNLSDLSGISVSAEYSNNTSVPLTLFLDMVEYDFTELGDTVITISYQDKTVDIDVTVINYVTGIEVEPNNSESKYYYDKDSTTVDFITDNTIKKTMAVGDSIVLTAAELDTVTVSSITPGHREITFTFGEFSAKHTYQIIYMIKEASEWDMLNTYLDGYFELSNDIDFELNTSLSKMIGRAPLNGSEDYVFDGENNGTTQTGIAFIGKFDGKGFKLLNFKYEDTTYDPIAYGVGLFGYIGAGAEVKNFTLKGANIRGWQRLGFIAGMLEGTISNIIVDEDSTITGGGAWAQLSVVAFKRGAGVISNVICLQKTGNYHSGTINVVLVNQSYGNEKITNSYVTDKYVTEILSIQNTNIKVIENTDIDLSQIVLNVKYVNNTTGTVNPTSVEGLDKGLLGEQTITFKLLVSYPENTELSINGNVTVTSSTKTLTVIKKSEDTIISLEYNDGWNINNINWSEYVDVKSEDETQPISNFNISSNYSGDCDKVIALFTAQGFMDAEITIPIIHEVNSSNAISEIEFMPRANYVLTEDIDFYNCSYEYLVNGEFFGQFDGKSHKLFNIDLYGTGDNGIFRTNYGTIKNLFVEINININDGYSGTLVATNESTGVIRNVYVKATGHFENGGGLLNYNKGLIENCVVDCDMDNTNFKAFARVNQGTIDNSLAIVNPNFTNDFATNNGQGRTADCSVVKRNELEYNVDQISDEFWNKALSDNRVVAYGIYLKNDEGLSSIVDNYDETYACFYGDSLSVDAFIQVDYGMVIYAKTIYVLMDSNDYLKDYKVYYGSHPTNLTLLGEFKSNEVIATVNTEVRYIKIVNALGYKDNDTDIKVKRICVGKDESPLNMSLSGATLANDQTISNMYDNDPTTEVYFSNVNPNGYIEINLGSVKEITSIEINQGNENNSYKYLNQSSLYYSLDGIDFTLVDNYTVRNVYKYFSPFIMARYFRFIYTGLNDTDLIIREIKVNEDILLTSGTPYSEIRAGNPVTSIIFATDNDKTTSLDFNTDSSDRTIILDLHEIKTINYLKVLTDADWGDKCLDGLSYSFSNDNNTYTTPVSVSGNSKGSYRVYFDEDIECRFIKITFNGESWVGITEVSATHIDDINLTSLKIDLISTNNIIYPKGEINSIDWSQYFTLKDKNNNDVSFDDVNINLSSNNGKSYIYFTLKTDEDIKTNTEVIYLYYEVNDVDSFLAIDDDLNAWYAQTDDIGFDNVFDDGNYNRVISVARSVEADGADSYKLNNDKVFNGVYDGNGYSLQGLYDKEKGLQNYDYCYAQSLFGIVGEGAVLRNITISDFKVYSRNFTGLLVSENRGEIYNIKINNSEIMNMYGSGGIIAYKNSGLISNVFITESNYRMYDFSKGVNYLLGNNTNGIISSVIIEVIHIFDSYAADSTCFPNNTMYLVNPSKLGEIHNINGLDSNSLEEVWNVYIDDYTSFGVFNDCWEINSIFTSIKHTLNTKTELNLYDFVAQERVWGYKDTQTHGGVIRDNVVRKEDGTVDIIVNGSYYEGEKLGVNTSYSDVYGGKKTGADLKSKEAYSYGTFEVVMTIPSFNGICTSMWLFNYFEDGLGGYNNYEIDIEVHGSVLNGNALTGENLSGILCSSWLTETDYESVFRNVGYNLADGKYHKFTIEWTPDFVKYYVDEVLLEVQTDHIPTNKMYLNIGAWFPNSWCGEANFESDVFNVKSFKYTPYTETSTIGERESDTIVSNTKIRPWIKTIEKNLIANPTFDESRSNMVWELTDGSTLSNGVLNGVLIQNVELDAFDNEYRFTLEYKGYVQVTIRYESLAVGVISSPIVESHVENHSELSVLTIDFKPIDDTTILQITINTLDPDVELSEAKLVILNN